MTRNPRLYTETFFNWKELSTSILQGLMITAGTLLAYRYAVHEGFSEAVTRTMVFIVLISANIFLTLVNRSFYYSILTTIKYKNNLVPLIIGITLAIVAILLYVSPLTKFFKFSRLNAFQLLVSNSIGCISVIWYELVKFKKTYTKRTG